MNEGTNLIMLLLCSVASVCGVGLLITEFGKSIWGFWLFLTIINHFGVALSSRDFFKELRK